jgi:hypothetical protein
MDYLVISNFRRVLNVVLFLLGYSPASEFYVPTFRNTLFLLHRSCEHTADEEGIGCFETSAYKIQAPGNRPKERTQHPLTNSRRTCGPKSRKKE